MNREQTLLQEIKERAERVAAIWDRIGDAAIDDATKKDVGDLELEIEAREKEVASIREQAGMRAKSDARKREQATPVNGLGAPQPQAKDGTIARVSPGDLILGDAAFKAWRDSNMIGATFSKSKFGHSPRVVIPGGLKTLITGMSDTSAGALMPAYEFYPSPLTGLYARPLTIRDLLTTGTTTSDAIEYALEGTPTNNAAVVAEATATGGSTGSKPESALPYSKATAVVKTVAHWVPATRQALADAGQLRMYVETFLRYGVQEELEDQVIAGDGLGDNFTGVLNVSGTTPQAFDTDVLTTTRRARTKVRVTGRATPTAYVMHPNDWEDIDLLQDNEGRYYYGGPSVIGSPRLWGLPVVESEAMTEGTSVCADWRRAVLLDREQVMISASDSHLDFFTRNLVAILAELRAAFFLLRPASFVEIDLTP